MAVKTKQRNAGKHIRWLQVLKKVHQLNYGIKSVSVTCDTNCTLTTVFLGHFEGLLVEFLCRLAFVDPRSQYSAHARATPANLLFRCAHSGRQKN